MTAPAPEHLSPLFIRINERYAMYGHEAILDTFQALNIYRFIANIDLIICIYRRIVSIPLKPSLLFFRGTLYAGL